VTLRDYVARTKTKQKEQTQLKLNAVGADIVVCLGFGQRDLIMSVMLC